MADERRSEPLDRAERALRIAEGVARLGIAIVLIGLVVWSVGQEPTNDSDWSMDAVRLGLLLTAALVLVRAPGVRWPKG